VSRFKSAVIVFVVLAGAIVTAVSFDYTHTYVEDRFHDALSEGQYKMGEPFSLDAFLEYYDWDEVCVVIHGQEHDLVNRARLPYELRTTDEDHWMLVFVKSYHVVAEISVSKTELLPPEELSKMCYERWEAIVELRDFGGTPKIRFVGD